MEFIKDVPVSVVMPCYNEDAVIEKVVRAWHDEVISRIDGSEMIVIDDCSRDNTHNILERLKSEFPGLRVLKTVVNSGHGKAMRLGYESSVKEYVFQVDSDNQFEAGEFWKLYALKDSYDFILGFRKKRQDSITRLILTRIIRFMNLLLFRVWIKDVNCPFRLIKREILCELLKGVDKEALAPNIMISILARRRKIKMAEILVAHHQRKTGVVSIANLRLFKFALKGFKQLMAMKRCF